MTLDDVIRRALDAEAATVEVRPDALATIRAATRRLRTRWMFRGWIGGGLAVAAAATAVFFAVDHPRPAPRPAAPTASPSPDPNERLLAVYYLGPNRPDRLVREFHRVTPASGTLPDRLTAALTMMFDRPPADPDYASAWPAGTAVRAVRVDGDVVTVDLGGATAPTAIAAQQLVWTVTATSMLPGVRIGAGGEVLRRASAVDTLAPVWLINPQEGDTVRAQLDIHVAGFASVARMRLTDADGKLVVEREVDLTGGSPAQREGNFGVAIRPGRYTVTVTIGGQRDDHTFLVVG
ncbi:MAG TPA: GerMN domain-containing protein [Asanoa sp.]|nr:GerMN domain-containing protein [Asanoa sp.]